MTDQLSLFFQNAAIEAARAGQTGLPGLRVHFHPNHATWSGDLCS
jgi:hypothetical protein